MTATCTPHRSAPCLSHAELDALALRARSGDREAEDATLCAITPLVKAIVYKVSSRTQRVAEHAEDLLQDGLKAALSCIRRYDGTTRLVKYLRPRVEGEIRTCARMFFSRVGGRVSRTATLDLSAPIFTEYTPIDTSERVLGCAQLTPAWASTRGDAKTRLHLMLRMRRLTQFEKEIVCRRWGIPVTRASTNPWARKRAEEARPESLDAIGRDYEVSGETIRIAQASAEAKLGLLAAPYSSRSPRPSRN